MGFWKRVSFFLSLLLLFVAALTVVRFIFYFKYIALFSNVSFWQISIAMLGGLRFDFSTAATLLSPFTLLIFFPGVPNRMRLVKPLLYLMLFWELLLIIWNVADVAYFSFVQRHMTFEIVNVAGDIDVMLMLAVKSYLPWILIGGLGLAVYAWFFLGVVSFFLRKKKRALMLDHQKDVVSGPIALAVILLLSVVFIRGGLQMKPLGVKNAFQDENVELGILSLNGLYTTFSTVYRSYKGEGGFAYLDSLPVLPENREQFFKSLVDGERETVDDSYPLARSFDYFPEEARRYNVVIFVMESWSAKFSKKLGGQYSALPNFDALSAKGFLATNALANAQRSIEGLAAIMGSLPVWKGMVLGQGGLLYQTRFLPIGSLFLKRGYDTFFIHGARPGSMGFDGLAKRLGFLNHISRDDFELTKENNDPVWGIYDEFIFGRADEEFKKSKKPFAAVVFSLTSHSPYSFPDKGAFKKFDDSVAFAPFLNSLKYSDWALARFFKKAEESDYFRNTIFVIVGDHAEGESTSGSLYESYSVPMLFYAPDIVKAGRFSGVATQLDIFPTIMDIMQSSSPFTSWGKSLFSVGKRKAVLPRGDLFVYQEDDYMLLSDLEKSLALYNISKDKTKNIAGESKAKSAKLIKSLQEYVKFSSDLIRDNRVIPPE